MRREGVDHERDVHEAGPGRDVSKIGDPQRIRPRRPEVPVDPIERAWHGLVAARRADRLAAHGPLQAHGAHQPRHRAPGHRDAVSAEPAPDLAHAIDPEVLIEHALDLTLEDLVSLGPLGEPGRIAALGGVLMVGGRGDRQDPADRLDPVRLTMIVDEGDHGLNRRSSSAWAK
jgi:hypothetical protein